MRFQNCDFYTLILSHYEKLASMKEPFDLNEEHSKEWLAIFKEMKRAAKQTAYYMWPDKELNPKDFSNYNRFRIADTLIKILHYYNPEKGNFDRYFICVLRKDVFKQHTHIQNRRNDELRAIPLSENAQKKINKCLSIIKIYNRNHPDQAKLTLEDAQAKKMFMEQKVFKSEKSMENYLSLNRESYKKKSPDNLENQETSVGAVKYFSKNAAVGLIDIQDSLPELFNLIDEAYVKKINKKKQNADAQKKKEDFLKDCLTCHYYLKYKGVQDFKDEAEWNLISIMQRHKFFSRKIIKRFQSHEEKIHDCLKNQTAENLELLDSLIKTTAVTVEKISLENEYPFNYGYRVLGSFKDFLRKEAELQDIPVELTALI